MLVAFHELTGLPCPGFDSGIENLIDLPLQARGRNSEKARKQVEDAASKTADKASELASATADKASELADRVQGKSSADKAGDKAEDAKNKTKDAAKDAKGKICPGLRTGVSEGIVGSGWRIFADK